jgi:beta-glucanase (GH16 family)
MSEQCRATKFESADTFTSGYVETMLKVPKASSGFIAAFYLRSETGDDTAEDEIDFEWFFKPGVNGVQSNYFTKGIGRGLNERWHSALLLAESQNNWNKFGIRWVNDQFVEWFINDKSIRRIELVNAPTSINYPMKVYFSFWAADSRVYNWAGIPDWTLPIDDYEFQIKYMAVCQG